MTTMSMPSAPLRTGAGGPTVPRNPHFATRRRLFLLGCLFLLVIVAFAADYGPVRHYRVARARLEQTTAQVETLKNQKAALESQLGKLGQADYVESLARQELTYARPGEDLYIVTGLPGAASPATVPGVGPVAGLGVGASGLDSSTSGTDGAAAAGAGAGTDGAAAAGAGAGAADRPGFLERALSAITGLF